MKPLSKRLAFIKANRWRCNVRQRVHRVLDVFKGRPLKMKPRYLYLGRSYARKLKRGEGMGAA